MEKKLKDLKKGDRVWLYDFTGTTEIYVERKKREGQLMTVVLKWGESEYECFGPALGWTCVGYNKKWKHELIFTSSFHMAYEREARRRRVKNLGEMFRKVMGDIDNI